MYKLSASNQIRGTVAAVKEGAVNGVVTLDTPAGLVKADITMEAIRELGLREGVPATAVVNACDVLLEVAGASGYGYSAGNVFAGEVVSVAPGAVSSIVRVKVAGGIELTSDMERECAEAFGLRAGVAVSAVVSSSDVLVACEG